MRREVSEALVEFRVMWDEARLQKVLSDVRSGAMAVGEAEQLIAAALRAAPFEDLSSDGHQFSRVDHHRALRQGFPEIIYCAGKTPEQTASIAHAIVARGSTLLATRADAETFAAVQSKVDNAHYHELARIIHAPGEHRMLQGTVGVLCAGTSDLPVAEEAAVTLEVLGAKVQRFCDVGVAGLHRLLASIDEVRACDVIIVVAGMEGALPSVVGGLVDVPVIAVPTSVGYGANFGGLAALLGMLNSCASGLTVVNIDNGFGAGMGAAKILRLKSSQ
jgi:NCAIR mutase (PurE)-related protein